MSFKTWRAVSAYPRSVSPDAAELFDVVEELLPLSPDSCADRKTVLTEWLSDAESRKILTPRERAYLVSEIGPSLHDRPDRYYLHLFIDDQFQWLYEDAEKERLYQQRETAPKGIRLCACNGRFLVVLEPRTNRTGVVVRSNIGSIPKGSLVRSRVPWMHASRLRESWDQNTTYDPRWLSVVSVPQCARGQQFRRAA